MYTTHSVHLDPPPQKKWQECPLSFIFFSENKLFRLCVFSLGWKNIGSFKKKKKLAG